jgi:hypothetical protein
MANVNTGNIEGNLYAGKEVDRAADNFYAIVILQPASADRNLGLVIEPVPDSLDFYFSAHHARFLAKYENFIRAGEGGTEVLGRYRLFRMRSSPFSQTPEASILPTTIHVTGEGTLTFGTTEFPCWVNASGERPLRNLFRSMLAEYIQQAITE